MAAQGQRLIPFSINLDLANQYMQPNQARFIKNLVYELGDFGDAGNGNGADSGVMKPLMANALYFPLALPSGNNHVVGTYSSRKNKELLVAVHNSNNNHVVYRLNGLTATGEIVYQSSDLALILQPQNFIHEGGSELEVIWVIDPATGLERRRSFWTYTTGANNQKQICIEDAIATNGFNATQFPYFAGTYDRKYLINMGLPTPKSCVSVTEVPRDAEDGFNNNLLFNTWQFRITEIDVWGRPSEHSIISDIYIPGINDCIGASSALARCLDLAFQPTGPLTNQVQVEFRNCNNTVWQIDTVLNLYNGSNLGDWWLRSRNPDVNYDFSTNTITYRFCRDKECQTIPVEETNRLFNPLARRCQAISKIGSFLATANNLDGFNPFPKSLKDQIKFIVEGPDQGDTELRTIEILVPIYNTMDKYYSAVAKDGTLGYYYGGYGGADNPYDQKFGNIEQSGFGGYLAGTGNFVISTQVKKVNGVLVDDPGHSASTQQTNGIESYQKFVFTNLQPAVYTFRIFSNLTDPSTNSNWDETSMPIWGLVGFDPASLNVINPEARTALQELTIDVCNGNYSSLTQNQVLSILDVSSDGGKVTAGYVYETRKNGFNELPMELMSVLGANGFFSTITDHNGFYYFGTKGTGRNYAFAFQYNCGTGVFNRGETAVGITFENHFLDEIEGYTDYSTMVCNRIEITGRAVLTNGVGAANASIVLSRGRVAVTDANGYYTIIAHDDQTQNPRQDQVMFVGGACLYKDENDGCISPKPVIIYRCTGCTERVVELTDFVLTTSTFRSLLSGGTYGGGIVGFDFLGRATYVQPIQYFTIPTITQSRTIGPSRVRVTIDPNAIFPPEIEYVTMWLTEETTIEDYLDWIVDKVEFIDNTGNVNNIAPTQIKIYDGSIIEYNKQNEFNTTTKWDFIPEGQTTPVTADTVEFFINGDGTYFNQSIKELVKYSETGEYFLINYTDALKDLKQNALIRLVRPKVCASNDVYFELCNIIDIKNGHATQNNFYIDAFDTYYLPRAIPVPTSLDVTPETTTVTTTTTVGNTTTQVVSQSENSTEANEIRTFGFLFEHHSPSNFWGYRCHNIGRVNSKNPYEAEILSMGQIALSGGLSPNSQLNYLNYFDDLRKDSPEADISGIVGMYPTTGKVFVLGQTDWYLIGYNDNLARVDANGNISVPSGSGTFGKPNDKSGQNYGCNLFDKNTIRRRKGLVQFLDTNMVAVLQYNYASCNDISTPQYDENGAQDPSKSSIYSWLLPKVKYIQEYNRTHTNKKYFHGVINPANFEYILTDFQINSGVFLNKERDYDVTKQESFAFSIYKQFWKGMYSFVPEYYGFIEGEKNGQQLFSFKNGMAYRHYVANQPTAYNTFYGEKCGRVYRWVFGKDAFKKKKYLCLEAYCPQSNYWADKITTETNQESRILIPWWKEGMYMWAAPFLCDINTPTPTPVLNNITEGNTLYGTWIDVRLIGDESKDDVYSELTGVTIWYFTETNSGTKEQ